MQQKKNLVDGEEKKKIKYYFIIFGGIDLMVE